MKCFRIDLVFSIGLTCFIMGCGQPAGTSYIPADSSETVAIHARSPNLNTESYDHLPENDFVSALQNPLSTFSVDVDTASYSNVRRFLTKGQLPPVGAVRIEELINYFTYDYQAPDDGDPFSVHVDVASCPWTPAHKVARIALQGKKIESEDRKPANLVFLLDVSGSMRAADKLPLVKSAMRMLVEHLTAEDRIAIVVYAGATGLVLPSTSAAEQLAILSSLENLESGGSTNGGAGIQLAYQIANDNFIPDGINRVILCTDGDFNVGLTDNSQLVGLVETKAKSNIFLTILGFGTGNLNDSLMEELSNHGNGNYAYIDSINEARKTLVDQIGGTLVTIAKDVKIQVDFNPQVVHQYRLIGYENRKLAEEDFTNDQKDAGDIGAGHSVTALYEIIPISVEQEQAGVEPSKYLQTQTTQNDKELLTVRLRYKHPDESESKELRATLEMAADNKAPTGDFRFACAVAEFGLILRGSKYIDSANWESIRIAASDNLGNDANGYRAEFLRLVAIAHQLKLNARP